MESKNLARTPSRRASLKAAWLGIHACLPSAGSRGERTGTGSRHDGRKIRAKCLHPRRSRGQDHAGHAAGRDGAGRLYGVAMILAEELDADYAKVVLEHAPPNDKLYGNPIFGIQVTGNSNSIARSGNRCAKPGPRRGDAGAGRSASMAGRSGKLLGVEWCGHHAASGRTLAYGNLADAAGAVPAPQNPRLKDPKDFTLIGKPLKRFDTRARSMARRSTASTRSFPG